MRKLADLSVGNGRQRGVGRGKFSGGGGDLGKLEIDWEGDTVNVLSSARKYLPLLAWCLFGRRISSAILWIVKGGPASKEASVDIIRSPSSRSF